MILKDVELGPILSKVFTVYAIVWVAVIAIVYIGIGALLKKRDRLLAKHKGGGH